MYSLFWMEALVLMNYALEAWYSKILPFHITFLLLARISWRKCKLVQCNYELLIDDQGCVRRRDGLDAVSKWHARIKDPSSIDILLFPFHINGNHWYLQVVIIHPLGRSTLKTASLFILDSLGCKAGHKIHADTILLYLRQYWPDIKNISVHSSKVSWYSFMLWVQRHQYFLYRFLSKTILLIVGYMLSISLKSFVCEIYKWA